MKYALAIIYIMVGMGTCAGVEIYKDKKLAWEDRALYTVLWPSFVTGVIVITLLKAKDAK